VYSVRMVATAHCNGILMNPGIYWRFDIKKDSCGHYKGKLVSPPPI